ncbi:unnamed protein product, partial [Brenthis ino]
MRPRRAVRRPAGAGGEGGEGGAAWRALLRRDYRWPAKLLADILLIKLESKPISATSIYDELESECAGACVFGEVMI